LTARYLEKLQRVQALLIGRVAARLDLSASPSDPRPAAIVAAAFACMQAARASWLGSDRSEPFETFLDNAMSTFSIDVADITRSTPEDV
jgi:hypothetical protein